MTCLRALDVVWVRVCAVHVLLSMSLAAREKRTPTWAVLAPVLYLLACGLAARAVFQAHDDAGVPGLLAAVGLFPAFVIPAVFSTCKVKLAAADGGLAITGLFGTRIEKIDEIRLEHAPRGEALLHVTMRNGDLKTFLCASYSEAQLLVAKLPPISAPAGALAA
jgi:hypothetical protein